MIVFRKKLLYAGKGGCIRARVAVIGQKCMRLCKRSCIGEMWLYSGKSGCLRARWLYSDKNGCIRGK